MKQTRLGAVSYLNSRPLVHGLHDRSDLFTVRFDVPSVCADLLEAGEIDLGLIPALEAGRHRQYLAVPDVAIASYGPVRSVALFTSRPVEAVRRIALDTSSRTSAGLVRILCETAFGIRPTFEPAAPDLRTMLAEADAALLIGDPALFADADALGVEKIDLGEVWTSMTGLPFVWAFWAGRPDAASAEVCRELRDAKVRGRAAIDVIAREFGAGDREREAVARDYLEHAVRHDLDADCEQGLRRYYDLAWRAGLLPSRVDVRFFGD